MAQPEKDLRPRISTWADFIGHVAEANRLSAILFAEGSFALRFAVCSSLPNARQGDPTRTPIAWRVGSAVEVRVSLAPLLRPLGLEEAGSDGGAGPMVDRTPVLRSAEAEFAEDRSMAAEDTLPSAALPPVGRETVAQAAALARMLSAEERAELAAAAATQVGSVGVSQRLGEQHGAGAAFVAKSPADHVVRGERYLRLREFYMLLGRLRTAEAEVAASEELASKGSSTQISPPATVGAALGGGQVMVSVAPPDTLAF
jgi:hypothetical protein